MNWKFWNKRKESKTIPQNRPPGKINPTDNVLAETRDPCLRCGACCAFFLVSFPSQETQSAGGSVPFKLTGKSVKNRRYMKGTETKHPRCTALDGFIGARVSCRIYNDRPSICKAFSRSWKNDASNFLCDRARAAYGLQTFSQY